MDCRHAIDTEPSLVKAYFFQGQALGELELYDESIASLKRGQLLQCYFFSTDVKMITVDEVATDCTVFVGVFSLLAR